MAHFLDTHGDDRWATICSGHASRTLNALTFVMLHSGLPIVQYGTEQMLQSNIAESASQMVDPSMWQTRYLTDTDAYKLIATLNRLRRIKGICNSKLILVHTDASSMVFARGSTGEKFLPPDHIRHRHNSLEGGAAQASTSHSSVWVFVNNDAIPADGARLYCTAQRSPPIAPRGYMWVDEFSGIPAQFDELTGCFAADDSYPKVLTLRQVEVVESEDEYSDSMGEKHRTPSSDSLGGKGVNEDPQTDGGEKTAKGANVDSTATGFAGSGVTNDVANQNTHV